MDNTLLQPQNMPPLTKYTLSDYGRRSFKQDGDIIVPDEIEITGYEDTEDGLEVKFIRDGLKGVVIELSVPQQFTRDAYDKLYSLFELYGLNACCNLNVYQRDDVDVSTYTKLKTFGLDFSTISISDDIIEIQTDRTSLQTFIKSGGKTKFDYDLTRPELTVTPWNYFRMLLTVSANWIMPEVLVETDWIDELKWVAMTPLLDLSKYLRPFDSVQHMAMTQDIYTYLPSTTPPAYPYFFQAAESGVFDIAMKFDFALSGDLDNSVSLTLSINNGASAYMIKSWVYNPATGVQDTIDFNQSITLAKNDTVTLMIGAHTTNYSGQSKIAYVISNFENFSLSYMTKGKYRAIGCVDPSDLLQWLIDSMTDNRVYTGVIEWDANRLYKSVLACSDCIRDIDNSVMHTSFNDFADWMRAKGYEYDIDGTQLTFKKRDLLFPTSTVITELGEREVAELVIEADKENAYNSLEIGYEKQDYGDNTIGYLETNGKFDYKTDLISQDDNKLSLISPYRADSIGIELLCWEDISDKGKTSDNDIFEVAVNLINERGYNTYEDITMVCDGTTLFNAVLNPYYMLKDNLSMLGIITENMYFESTDAYRKAVVSDGTNIYEDITINQDDEQLFKPFTVNFALSSHIKFPTDDAKNGIIQLPYKGRTYQGYLKDVTRNYTREIETDVTLFLKSITT